MTAPVRGNYIEEPASVFNQSLFEASAVQKHRLGTKRVLDDGRVFVYAKMGAVAGVAGSLYQSEVPDANLDELVMLATDLPAVGEKEIYFTNGATAITLNMFRDGFCVVNKGTSAGHMYKISGNPAIGAATAGKIDLYDAVRVAGVALDEITLVKNPYDGVIIHPSPPTALPLGICPIAVTASYYFWLQTAGICAALTDGTLVIGNALKPSETTDGAVCAYLVADAGDLVLPEVGRVIEVGATGEWSLIDLCLHY